MWVWGYRFTLYLFSFSLAISTCTLLLLPSHILQISCSEVPKLKTDVSLTETFISENKGEPRIVLDIGNNDHRNGEINKPGVVEQTKLKK